jgi:hypothetical protein
VSKFLLATGFYGRENLRSNELGVVVGDDDDSSNLTLSYGFRLVWLAKHQIKSYHKSDSQLTFPCKNKGHYNV